ncbi:hypothetical protein J4P02_18910 [Pseudomonas sp. NFXW11]|uniref:hypothetical protein n=1 Tax=Pseudomonas sp. NFXW11 TaxID=2819531 RepID=UPI003CF19EA5
MPAAVVAGDADKLRGAIGGGYQATLWRPWLPRRSCIVHWPLGIAAIAIVAVVTDV